MFALDARDGVRTSPDWIEVASSSGKSLVTGVEPPKFCFVIPVFISMMPRICVNQGFSASDNPVVRAVLCTVGHSHSLATPTRCQEHL